MKVARAIEYCWKSRPFVDCSAVAIERAARQYQTFMESLL